MDIIRLNNDKQFSYMNINTRKLIRDKKTIKRINDLNINSIVNNFLTNLFQLFLMFELSFYRILSSDLNLSQYY